jgi:hypothetical protein
MLGDCQVKQTMAWKSNTGAPRVLNHGWLFTSFSLGNNKAENAFRDETDDYSFRCTACGSCRAGSGRHGHLFQKDSGPTVLEHICRGWGAACPRIIVHVKL